MSNYKKSTLLALPYLVWGFGFIVIPLILLLSTGLTNERGYATFANLVQIFKWENYRPLFLSLILSAISTAVCLVLSFPIALILRKNHVGRGSFVAFIFILPMWMNSLLRILAWQTLLERRGVINEVLGFFGLPGQRLINTPAAVVLGMVYDFLPFMILPVYNAVSRIDENVINAAYDLGASRLQTLFKVIVPLSVPGIAAGVNMVFVPALTTFAISNMLGGGKIYLIGNVIEQEFMQNADWNAGAGLSLVLMIFIIISMIFLSRYNKDGGDMF